MIIRSVEDHTGAYCIDFIEDEADGTFTFKLFRKEPEDYGRWSLTADYSRTKYKELGQAMEAAKVMVPWFSGKLAL
ncbi:hypothetical protein G5S34_08085 [Herbaspirillum frisingense]|uniref:hypothetical protein n=1 Tax=Herbaspirillum frisingense TaxID=92645 RepID=UPI0015FEDCF4|nr:hypothetical protein [Herbaspirillum frisingense]QNB06730.1 hypothetical protein G5S34_08085 [Herbaspirillum frisingense]